MRLSGQILYPLVLFEVKHDPRDFAHFIKTSAAVNNIVKNLVYSGNKSNVRMTMVGGKVLYKDGTYNIGVSPETVYKNCNEIADRILRQ